MIRILICDDDELFAGELESIVAAHFSENDINASVKVCTDAGLFRNLYVQWEPDLIFLDLIFQDADGFQLAEQLRTSNLRTELVFITNYPERMPNAFAYRPIGFVAKPASPAVIADILERFMLYYREHTGLYSVNTRDYTLQIPVSDILYFESDAHQVKIYHRAETVPVHQTRRLDDIAAELKNFPFIRIHKSFLVSATAIAQIDKRKMTAVLRNGAALPISRRYYTRAMEQFIHYQLR